MIGRGDVFSQHIVYNKKMEDSLIRFYKFSLNEMNWVKPAEEPKFITPIFGIRRGQQKDLRKFPRK